MSDSAPEQEATELLILTAQIVAAHVGRNPVAVEALPDLITGVHDALARLGTAPAAEAPLAPAVPAKRSIHPDYLICLEDGAKVKMLKPYLERRFGLSPAAYRAKWGLVSDYPMVAPNYAARRSALARQIGLGRSAADGTIVEDSQAASPDTADAVAPDDAAVFEAADVEAEGDVGAEVATARAADGRTEEADEPELTAESVFANFGAGGPAEGSGPGKRKRKRFSDQMARQMPKRRQPG